MSDIVMPKHDKADGTMSMEINRIYCGDCRELLRGMPAESVHCIVTSPPYYSLRDYGLKPVVWNGDEDCVHVWRAEGRIVKGGKNKPDNMPNVRANCILQNTNLRGTGVSSGQFCGRCGAWLGCLGLEPTHILYVEHLVDVFREVWRVLRKDGTVWLNIGDSYASQGGPQPMQTKWQVDGASNTQSGGMARKPPFALKPKDLCLVPQRLAIALQDDGWWVRSIIIWSKPNAMPESVTDRPTIAHEYVLLLSKSKRYFFDADVIRESTVEPFGGKQNGVAPSRKDPYPQNSQSTIRNGKGRMGNNPSGRNKRTVWAIPTQPYPEAHFATFPKRLVTPMILAGTSPRTCGQCGSPWERIVERTGHISQREPAHVPNNTPTKVDSTGWSPTTVATERFRPTCTHYDELYKAEFPKARKARKRWQRDLSGNWWRRVRKRPGKHHWEFKPCVVLDPFLGSGTTAVVAANLGRDYMGIEANPDYVDMSERRVREEASNLVLPL